MSLNKQPSYVGIDEKAGKVTIAFLPTWYNVSRCGECPRLKFSTKPGASRVIAFCELMEEEKPCEVTGERYMSEENDVKT